MSIYVMSRVFKTSMGGANRKALAVRLADFADDEGRGIYPGVERLAAETELSERTVQRILADFESEGILICRQRATGRPGMANRYDFDLDRLFSGGADKGASNKTGDTLSPVSDGETGDNGAERGDNHDIEGCHGVTRTVIEPPLEPSSEREGAGATSDRSDIPGTADFEKRAMRLCGGDGYAEGEWKGWNEVTPGYIIGQFARLSAEDRKSAEQWRDAFLAKCRRDKVKPMPIGNFLRDRAWRFLSDRDLKVSTDAAARKAISANPDKSDDWAASFGPKHAARYFRILLAGPDRPESAPENGMWFSSQMRAAWPRLFGFWQQSDLKGGLQVDGVDHAVSGLLEFVPADSNLMATWRAEFKRRGWPEPRTTQRGGYFPAGGPAAIDTFMTAVQAADNQATRKSDDAA